MDTLKDIFDRYGVRQLGYYVESLEASAEFFHKALGAGPFVDLGENSSENCTVRGQRECVSMRTALGHISDIQLELIEVTTDGPDPYHEMGHYGLHHFCIWVDDVDAVVEELQVVGMSLAMRMTSGQGMQIAYLDARDILGQYVEVTTPSEQLWQGIKAVHEGSPSEAPALMPMAVLMQDR